MFTPRIAPLSFAFAAVALSSPASAQFGVEWLEFGKDNTHLSSSTISDTNNETDLAWNDLDQNGFLDLAVVRKQPFTSAGKRTNILLMNYGGVLTNVTSTYATDSDVGGDSGFNTPTNDRDVLLPDLTGDGWLDLVTATTLSDGEPKHIGHPRIYRNKGGSPSWNGLKFENSRFPQLLHYGTGLPQNPRFCSVAAGDVTGDGFADLYFGDYDSSGAGGEIQGSNEDMNDRLLINNGSGSFTDQSQARMTTAMLSSAFGMAVDIEDMNGDGRKDIVKDTALMSPQYILVSYNSATSQGNFTVSGQVSTSAPYHEDVGDLNNDGRLDLIQSDDGADRYSYNTGTNGLGQVIWAANKTYQFLAGSDDGFASNNWIVDLDKDGWKDTLHADVDVDIGGFSRRLHIYHNPGGTVGSQITLKEERQQSSGGWLGAKGLLSADLTGTFDFAPFDLDNDGDIDLVTSRSAGTDVWENKEIDGVFGTEFGTSTAGAQGIMTFNGITPPTAGSNLTVRLGNLTAGKAGLVGYSAAKYTTAVDLSSGLMLNVALPMLLMNPVVTDGSGLATSTVTLPPSSAGLSLYVQGVVLDGTGGNLWTSSKGLQFNIQ